MGNRFGILSISLSVIDLFCQFLAICVSKLLQMGNLSNKIWLILLFLRAPYLALLCSYYRLMNFLMIIAIYPDNSTLCSRWDRSSDLWQQLELTSVQCLQDTVDSDRKWLIDFNVGKFQLVSIHQHTKITGLWMLGSGCWTLEAERYTADVEIVHG